MAVTWLGYVGLSRAVEELHGQVSFLFYWWEPDPLNSQTPSEPVWVFFQEKDLDVSQIQRTVIVGHQDIRTLGPEDEDKVKKGERIDDLLSRMRISDIAAKDFAVKLSKDVPARTIACEWLRDPSVWRRLLPDPSNCQRGQEYVKGTRESVKKPDTLGPIDAFAECRPCLKNYFKNEPGHASCQRCPEGQHTTGDGKTQCAD